MVEEYFKVKPESRLNTFMKLNDKNKNLIREVSKIAPAIVPGAIGLGAVSQMQGQPQFRQGGVIKDDRGYWNPNNWGHPVEIDQSSPDSFIDMKGVYEPLLGVSNTGEKRLMVPNEKYKFGKGTKKVREYPISRNGNQLTLLDQLTNYNTKKPQRTGWTIYKKYNYESTIISNVWM
jgi:hypothetical protein